MVSEESRFSLKVATTSGIFLASLLFVVLLLQLWAIGTGAYIPFEYSTALLVVVVVHLVRRYGIISTPLLFAALLGYPVVIPLLSEYVFDVPLYAIRGQKYQIPAVVDKAVFLSLFALLVMAAVLEVVSRIRRTQSQDWSETFDGYRVHYYRRAFAAISVLVLVGAYLTTPGPTVLTADYETILNNYYSWANFAGSLFMGSWIVLFLMVQGESFDSARYRAFLVVTALGVLWLLLHARRNESMGVLALLIFDLLRNRFSLGTIVKSWRQLSGLILFSMVILGQVFVGSIRDGGGIDFSKYFEGAYTPYPGGAHNVWGTFQATVYLFPREVSHRLGKTFISYPIQSAPTGFFALFSVDYPELYSSFLGAQYQSYLGGSYILNPYFADFGTVGIVFAGVVFAAMAALVRWALVNRRSNHFVAGLVAVIVVAAFRAFWYTQLAWADAAQGFIAAFLMYLVVANVVNLGASDDEPEEPMASNV